MLNYWKHQRKVFKLVAQKYFNNNVYDTYNEYVFHLMMNFTFAWKNSIDKMTTQLTWNMEQLEKALESQGN